MDKNKKLKILLLEDLHTDAELVRRELTKQIPNFELKHVENKESFINAIADFAPDIILSDFQLPGFDGLEALKITLSKTPDTPFIIVTGSINEETAVECIKAGASDYILKDNLIRLVPALESTISKYNSIKEKKEAEKALFESEERFRRLAMNAKDMIFRLSLITGQYEFVSPAAKTIFGISPQQFYKNARIVFKQIHPKYSNLFKESWRNMKKEILPPFFEYQIIDLNGNIKWINQRSVLIYDKNNTPVAIEGILTDLTHQKEAEQKLIESEKKFRELADSLPEIVFEIDNQGQFVFLNKTAYSKFNIQKTDIPFSKLSIKDFVHPDELGRLQINFQKVVKGEIISGNEYKSILNTGETAYYQILNTPIVKDNQVIGIRGIAIDVTKRKNIEEELLKHKNNLEELIEKRTEKLKNQAGLLEDSQTALTSLLEDVNDSRLELERSNKEIVKLSLALEQSPIIVMITDINGKIEYVNQHFSKITGYSKNEVLSETPKILNSGTHPKEYFQDLWQTIGSGKIWHGEFCNKKKNGDLYWEFASISPLRDNNNNITHYIAVKEDISERKETEEQLKSYTQELEMFNKTMVDRELKIIEMKEEVNKYCEELGREIKYPPVWR